MTSARRWLTVFAVALLAGALFPGGRPLDEFGTCDLDTAQWAHETGVRVAKLLPDEVRVGTPFVMWLGGGWRMWYASGVAAWTEIRTATSADGLTWTREGVTLNASDFKTVMNAPFANILEPFVVELQNGTYAMFVELWENGFEGAGEYKIGRAWSADGLSWVDTSGGFAEIGGLAEWLASPVVEHIAEPPWTYRMWFTARASFESNRMMFSARSTDGVSFSYESSVMDPGGEDTNGPLRIHIGRERTADLRLYYSEYGVENRTYTATSNDAGASWTKEGVLLGLGPTSENNLNVSAPMVLQPDAGSGHMYYMATGLLSADYQIFSAATVTDNADPTANASFDQNVTLGGTATLAGTGSDADPSDTLSYAWSILSAPANSTASLVNASQATASLTGDLEGNYTLQLTVSDDCGGSATDATVVTATNEAPLANATVSDPSPSVGVPVTVAGTNSSDPDAHPVTYNWTLPDSPPNSTVSIADPGAAAFAVTPEIVGDYTFRLRVTDLYGKNATDEVTFSATNADPAANLSAFPAAELPAGRTVLVEGGNSTDADGHALAYSWTLEARPAASNLSLTNASGPNVTAVLDAVGTFRFRLDLSDGYGGVANGTIEVNATNLDPTPAIAVSPNTTVIAGTNVTLNASASSDPDGHPLSYLWTLVARPPTSSLALANETADTVSIIPDRAGAFVLQLDVTDPYGGSANETMEVTATNEAPVPSVSVSPGTSVAVGTTVFLNASGSSDPDGHPIAHAWAVVSKPTGSSVDIADPSSPTVNVTMDVNGTFVFRLDLSDPYGSSDFTDTAILVINGAPVPSVSISPGATVVTGVEVTVDASASSDPEGDNLTYSWTITLSPETSNASLGNLSGAITTLTPDRVGAYVVTLALTDSWGASTTHPVVLIATDLPPVPVFSVDPSDRVLLGTPVTVDANSSYDPEGHTFTFSWTLDAPNGSAVVIDDPAAPFVSFVPDVPGAYRLTLLLTDAYGEFSDTGIVIDAASPVTLPPRADAGPRQNVTVGTLAQLNGSGSSPYGGNLTFAWSFVLRPNGSAAVLLDASEPNASFLPDVAGDYVLQLNVADPSTGLSDEDQQVTTAVNRLPAAAACCDAIVLLGANASATVTASDPDGHPLTYSWSFLSRPAASSAAFADPAAADTTFPVDAVGVYVAHVVVADGYGGAAESVLSVVSNRPPTPLPLTSPGSTALIGTTVTFDGGSSYDPDGDPIAVSWTLADWPGKATGAAPPATESPVPSQLRVDATAVGTYGAALTVTDVHLAAETVVASVSVYNTVPTALVLCDAEAAVGFPVSCTAAGSLDPDAGHRAALAFAWAVTARPAGSAAEPANASAESTAVLADLVGNYSVTVTVTDPWGLSDVAVAVFRVTNDPPVAVAGEDRVVLLEFGGTAIVLDGTGSSDPDGHPLQFSWSIVGWPGAVRPPLDSNASARPSFTARVSGTYRVALTVFDGHGLSAVDEVVVTATQAPVARAGLNVTVVVGGVVTLDGSGSTDSEGPIAKYEWWVVSQPPGSDYALSNGSARVTFTADTAGVYAIRLRVTDGTNITAVDTVYVSVERPADVASTAAISGLGLALLGLLGFLLYRRSLVVIEDIFLLAKSGTLIKHYTRRLRPGQDSDVLSAMLVAVQNFVEDAFRGTGREAKPLEQFKFGDLTILVTKGEHLFLAALVSGPNPGRLLPPLSKTLRDVEEELGKVLEDWSGNMEKVKGADKYIEGLLGIKRR